MRGDAALKICSEKLLLMAVLDVDLPDINGYELARRMREQVDLPLPFIFLVESDRLVDNASFPEFEGEYYVTKPFAMKDVEQGIRTIRARMRINYWRNHLTRMPSGQAIENEFKTLLNRQDWALLYTSIDNMSVLQDALLNSLGSEGFDIGANIIRSVADLVEEIIEEHSGSNDFIGHIAKGNFVVVTRPEKSKVIAQQLCTRFARNIPRLYLPKAADVPLLALSVFILDGTKEHFTNIKEITGRIRKAVSQKETATHRSVA